MIWKLFYNVLVIPCLWLGFQLYGLMNRKAARALRGRRNLFEQFRTKINELKPSQKRVWFHSSSMGEFEQAKPIIAELKRRQPNIQIIVSFFSPSGYEHSQSYKLADVITYIPFDSYSNARKFIEIMAPTAFVMMRYDIWPNHLWILQKLGIPTFIANATLQKKMYRHIPWVHQFIRSLYNSIDCILTVSRNDRAEFDKFHLFHPILEVIGDTRYDQVWKRSAESRNRKLLDQHILIDKKVFIIGSSWREDEEQLIPAVIKLFSEITGLFVIIIPHEPTEENLEFLEKEINGKISNIRFSNMHEYMGENIILIDSVGILMALYQYAHVAFVGGSFGNGIHNVLEPASYGIPIIFGPRYLNSQEAIALLRGKAGFSGNNRDELYQHIKMLLSNDVKRKLCGEHAVTLVKENVGATERFLSYMEKVL
jgi:3-deoxy-D-manno-octulosonic-acid transferase